MTSRSRRAALAAAACAAIAAQALPAGSETRPPFLAELVARGFFRALLGGDLPALLPLCGKTVDFDGERVSGAKAIEARLRSLTRRARQQRLRLRKLVVIDAAEMRRRFGPAPGRIERTARRGSHFALARLDRLGIVAILAREGRFYRVVGLTD